MRELTDNERVALEAAWQKDLKQKGGSWKQLEKAFTAGLEFQDARIAELDARIAELESDIKIAEMYKRYSEIEI